MPIRYRLMLVCALVLPIMSLSCGSGSTATVASTPTQTSAPFSGNIILGSPASTSIQASVFSADQSGSVSISYGTTSGSYGSQTSSTALQAGTPLIIRISGLSANTQYFYRLNFQQSGASGSSASAEHSFRTTRPPGSAFTFTVQADSHLDENSDLDLYKQTLTNVLADSPDFHISLGDTFMCEKYSLPLTANSSPATDQPTVNARFVYERDKFGIAAHSVPLFLVNGNHDGEAGWVSNGTAQSLAVWTTLARQQYFVNPAPDSFYSGDAADTSFVGKRAAWYSWSWGDALFVVLDPYWNTAKQPNSDAWNLTLGQTQYNWLAQTLAASNAKFKFVFIHNLVGGLDGQMRGGIEAAPYFEWGGRDATGVSAFGQKRPGWAMPIHPLLVQNHVTAVFHGHDHLYAKQVLDGIVYQEVPQPSARNTSSGQGLANAYHYTSGTIVSSSGHLRVKVTPATVTVEYVRAWLPASETAQQKNRNVDDSWTVNTP